jgi:hypothetical protein
MVFDDNRKLIRYLASITPMKLNYVMMMVNFLTFDFKLTLLHGIVRFLEVDEKSNDTRHYQCCYSSTSYARRFQQHSRSRS